MKVLKNIDYILLLFLAIVMIILVSLQVLNRILPFRAFWTLELLKYSLGAGVWMGVSVAVKENKHIELSNIARSFQLDKLRDLFPRRCAGPCRN